MSNWVQQVKEHAQEDVIKILLANKADMKHEKVINTEEGEELARKNDMAFFETSARTGQGIKEAFELIAGDILKKREKNKKETPGRKPSIQ